MEHVADAVEEHEDFHDVEITPVATDGGQDTATYYLVDEARSAVVDGPFTTQTAAADAAEDYDEYLVVATKRALDLVETTEDTTIRWEHTDDADLVTDGGQRRDRWRRADVDAVRQHAGVGAQQARCRHTDGPLPCVECFFDGGESA